MRPHAKSPRDRGFFSIPVSAAIAIMALTGAFALYTAEPRAHDDDSAGAVMAPAEAGAPTGAPPAARANAPLSRSEASVGAEIPLP